MSNDVKTKNDEEIRLFFSAGDRMMKGIDALRKKNRPLLGGHRYLTDGELSRLLHINRRTLQDYRNVGRIPLLNWVGKFSTEKKTWKSYCRRITAPGLRSLDKKQAVRSSFLTACSHIQLYHPSLL